MTTSPHAARRERDAMMSDAEEEEMKKDWKLDEKYQGRQFKRQQILTKRAQPERKNTPFYDPAALKEQYR